MKSDWLYSAWLRSKGAAVSPKRPILPVDHCECGMKTLQTEREYQKAIGTVRSLGLHLHPDPPKNWDALSALKTILHETESNASILDAGGGDCSPLIEWLWLYGYDHLHVQNIDFEDDFQRGDIIYQNKDFTDTGFRSNSLDAIVCLSVIEHGVPIRDTLEEFYEILKPGGILIISTDYWEGKVCTRGKNTNYGGTKQKWDIFSREEMKEVLTMSKDIGFNIPEQAQFEVDEKTVKWKGKSFTFFYLELKK